MALQYTETGGGTLAIYVQGDGPLVVSHPGMGDTRNTYAPLTAQLAAKCYRVANTDARGHGDEAASENLITEAQKLGNGHPVVLARASFSAGGAVIAAGKRPDLARA